MPACSLELEVSENSTILVARDSVSEKFLDVDRWESLLKGIRIVVWILGFVKNVRLPIEHRVVSDLSFSELEQAKLCLIRAVQAESFEGEISLLKEGSPVKKSSSLFKLSPCLDEQGWLNTGDLGYLSDGEIVITGRAKDLIIMNGRNIWPQDIEWSVERDISLCRTGDVSAFSVQNGNDETIVVLVQCRATSTEARESLRTEIGRVISGVHGLQCQVVLVPHNSLPHTSSGKLSRTKSRIQYLDGTIAELSAP